jgi:hypothetical protein
MEVDGAKRRRHEDNDDDDDDEVSRVRSGMICRVRDRR